MGLFDWLKRKPAAAPVPRDNKVWKQPGMYDGDAFYYDLDGNKVGEVYEACGGFRGRPYKDGKPDYDAETDSGAGSWKATYEEAEQDLLNYLNAEVVDQSEAARLQAAL